MDVIGLGGARGLLLTEPGIELSAYGLTGCISDFVMREIGPYLLIAGPSYGTKSSSVCNEFGLK